MAEPAPYRLQAVDLDQRVIWGVEVRTPDGGGLAFGGQDQEADDGRPHTRVWRDGGWVDIHEQLRAANPLQQDRERVWKHRNAIKDHLARERAAFFRGAAGTEEAASLSARLTKIREELGVLLVDVSGLRGDLGEYERGQVAYAGRKLREAQRHAGPRRVEVG